MSADDIFLTSGSSQANYMIAELLIDPGDVVLVEPFTYAGTLNILRRFRADIRAVLCDQDGMLPDELERAVKTALAEGKRPKAIYTIPTFQNPQGWVMPMHRREAMVKLSHRYDVPVWEDDCYVELRFEGQSVPAISSLDQTGRSIYVGSFSKIVGPGMRLGYLTGPAHLLDRIAAVKRDGGVNQFAALAVHRYALSGLQSHVDEANHILRAKRDAMLAALEQNFGEAARWSHPLGGLFIWLEMPEGSQMAAAYERAFEGDVLYVAGSLTSADGISGANCARLCFGYNKPDEIREGIARLAEVFEREGLLTPQR